MLPISFNNPYVEKVSSSVNPGGVGAGNVLGKNLGKSLPIKDSADIPGLENSGRYSDLMNKSDNPQDLTEIIPQMVSGQKTGIKVFGTSVKKQNLQSPFQPLTSQGGFPTFQPAVSYTENFQRFDILKSKF